MEATFPLDARTHFFSDDILGLVVGATKLGDSTTELVCKNWKKVFQQVELRQRKRLFEESQVIRQVREILGAEIESWRIPRIVARSHRILKSLLMKSDEFEVRLQPLFSELAVGDPNLPNKVDQIFKQFFQSIVYAPIAIVPHPTLGNIIQTPYTEVFDSFTLSLRTLSSRICQNNFEFEPETEIENRWKSKMRITARYLNAIIIHLAPKVDENDSEREAKNLLQLKTEYLIALLDFPRPSKTPENV